MEKRRTSDRLLSKLNKGTLVALVSILLSIVFIFLSKEYKTICNDREVNAAEHKVFNQDLTSLKVIMPLMLEELKSINKTLRRK